MQKLPFNSTLWGGYTNNLKTQIENRIIKTDNLLLEKEYVSSLVKSHTIKHISFDFESISKSIATINIPGSDFPRAYDVYPQKHYPIEVAVYKIPYSDPNRLIEIEMQYPPMPSVYEISYTKNEVTIKFTAYGFMTGNETILKSIKSNFLNVCDKFKVMLTNLNAAVDKYNAELEPFIVKTITTEIQRRQIKKDSENLL